MEEKKTTRLFGGRRDIVIVAVILVVALLWVLLAVSTREAGAEVIVEESGVTVARYSLAVDGEYVLGGGSNVLVIEGGAAYMRSADCPDKTCVLVGGISYAGQTIVCLPNKITVTVVGSGGADLVS